MPATVADILRQSGLSEDQIKTLDTKVLTGFETVITQSQQQLENAELARRAQEQMYAEQIAPALDKWGNEKARLEAEAAFYRAQAEGAKVGGFIPTDAPGFVAPGQQARSETGQFVAGGNVVPGSPSMTEITNQIRTELGAQLGGAFGDGMWAMQEYQRLTSQFLPDDVAVLAREASAQRLPFKDYVERKYGFAEKRQAAAATKQKEHDDAIRAETRAAAEREFTEKYSSNPNVRLGEPSRFTTIDRAVKSGERKDPLSMTREARREVTRAAIAHDLADTATVQ